MKAARRRAAHTRAAGLVLAASMMIFSATSSPAMMRTSPVGRSSAVTVAASLRPSPVVWSEEPTWLGPLRHYSLKPTPLTPEQQWLATRAAKCVKWAESRDEYRIGGDEPHGGAWQFSVSTWHGIGESGMPNEASPAEQDAAAYKLWLLAGWDQWETAAGCGV